MPTYVGLALVLILYQHINRLSYFYEMRNSSRLQKLSSMPEFRRNWLSDSLLYLIIKINLFPCFPYFWTEILYFVDRAFR